MNNCLHRNVSQFLLSSCPCTTPSLRIHLNFWCSFKVPERLLLAFKTSFGACWTRDERKNVVWIFVPFLLLVSFWFQVVLGRLFWEYVWTCDVVLKCLSASDVCSFGVALWEIFSFGKQPYENVLNEDVFAHIVQEKLLNKPTGCPDSTYEIMRQCWNYRSLQRPSVQELVHKLQREESDCGFMTPVTSIRQYPIQQYNRNVNVETQAKDEERGMNSKTNEQLLQRTVPPHRVDANRDRAHHLAPREMGPPTFSISHIPGTSPRQFRRPIKAHANTLRPPFFMPPIAIFFEQYVREFWNLCLFVWITCFFFDFCLKHIVKLNSVFLLKLPVFNFERIKNKTAGHTGLFSALDLC